MDDVVVTPLVVDWPPGLFAGPVPLDDQVDLAPTPAVDVARLVARRAAVDGAPPADVGAADVARLIARRRAARAGLEPTVPADVPDPAVDVARLIERRRAAGA